MFVRQYCYSGADGRNKKLAVLVYKCLRASDLFRFLLVNSIIRLIV